MVVKLTDSPADVILTYGGIVDANPEDGRPVVRVYFEGGQVMLDLYLDQSWGSTFSERKRLEYDEVDGTRKIPFSAIGATLRQWAAEHGNLVVEGLHGRMGARMMAAGEAAEIEVED